MRINRALIFILTFLLFLNVKKIKGQDISKELKQGKEYFFNKEYDKALKSFQKEFKTNPSIEIKFWIAHTYAEMEEITKAKALFLEIIRTKYEGPEIEMSLVNLGNCYRSLKQLDSSYFYYDRAISEFPKMGSGYFNKAQLLYSESKFEEAKNHYDKAIELESNDWWYYQKRLEVCFASKDYECALHDLIKVKALKPDQKNEMNFAYCYSMLKRYVEADSVFQLIYDEKSAFFLNNYGMNKYNMGMTSEGKEIIMKSLNIKPDNSYAYRNLAVISIAENDKKKACEYLNRAKSLGFEKQYGKEVNELLNTNCN